jgi:hypothetical protein
MCVGGALETYEVDMIMLSAVTGRAVRNGSCLELARADADQELAPRGRGVAVWGQGAVGR